MIDGYWHCEKCNELSPNNEDACLNVLCDGTRPTETPKNGASSDLTLVSSVDIPKPLKQGKKARSQKWAYKGMVLDSTDEKERYLYLESLQAQGIISDLARPTAIETRPKLIIPANAIHSRFEQRREVYTPDFMYRWRTSYILEDVKGKRLTKKLKKLKPRLHHGDANKIRDLQAMLIKQPNRIFLLTVFHNGYWHYFNSNQTEIEFSLEQFKSEAA